MKNILINAYFVEHWQLKAYIYIFFSDKTKAYLHVHVKVFKSHPNIAHDSI